MMDDVDVDDGVDVVDVVDDDDDVDDDVDDDDIDNNNNELSMQQNPRALLFTGHLKRPQDTVGSRPFLLRTKLYYYHYNFFY